MKSTINKQTEEYIDRMEQDENLSNEPTQYHIYPNAIDQLIIENDLQIAAVSFFPTLVDLILVVLSNKRVIKRNLSDFKWLHSAIQLQLENYKIRPMGVHWPELH